MKKYLIIYLVILLNLSCTNNQSSCEIDFGYIRFVNKASYCFNGVKEKKINDKKTINDLCVKLKELSKKEQLDDAYVNVNYGYIEVFSEDEEVLLSLIFSDFNGPIIRLNGKYYKDKKLINDIINYLKLKLKENPKPECIRMIEWH